MRLARPLLWWGRGLACAAGGLLLATAARAQLGASIAVDSDYRYRGVSLSDSKPSARLTLNYDAPERWYAGASATRATLTQDTYSQWLGYAGWATAVVDGRSFEIGFDASHFTGVSGYDFAEAYAGILAQRWSARLYYAPDYYGRHVQVVYAELNAHVPIDQQFRLFAHVGVLAPFGGAGGDADQSRSDVSAGAGLVVRGWDLHLAAVAATRRGPYPAVFGGRRAALVAGASFSF
ncbi:MAG: TorF family putative porin [Caldimonas sp.]